jgi:hypothetical protein
MGDAKGTLPEKILTLKPIMNITNGMPFHW